MDDQQLQRLHEVLCKRFDVRAGRHMLEFIQRRLNDGAPFPILAADARTGVPIHRNLDPMALNAALQQFGDAAS